MIGHHGQGRAGQVANAEMGISKIGWHILIQIQFQF